MFGGLFVEDTVENSCRYLAKPATPCIFAGSSANAMKTLSGRDPRSTPEPPAQAEADLQHVAGFLDAYFDRQVRPAALRSIPSIRSRIGVLKEYFGGLPVKSLERPDEINRFKTDSEYADEVEIATLHKVLATLRAATLVG